jgi:pilus assembly protein CpaB
MGRKTISILGLAVGCGLVAMYGAGQLLTKKEKPIEMRDVLLAARDLRAEEVLTPDVVRVVKQPANVVPAGAFSAFSEVEGRWIQIPILTDEPIVAAKLADKDSPPGLIGRIPKGMRAFAIEVNEQTGVSGFILPDHHVDVLQDLRDQRGGGRSAGARTILQDVLVLAVGQVLTRPEDKSIVVRTVTLAVTPRQAETLAGARSRGPLTLALRGLNDTEIVARQEPEPEEPPRPSAPPAPPSLPLVTAAAPAAPVPPPNAENHRRVMIIHGLHRTDVLRVPHTPVTAQPPVGIARSSGAISAMPTTGAPSQPSPEARTALAGSAPAG